MSDENNEAPKDGVKLIRASLNAELLKLNADLAKPDTNYDFVLDRIGEISKVLKKLPKPEVPADQKKTAREKKEESKRGTVFERQADSNR